MTPQNALCQLQKTLTETRRIQRRLQRLLANKLPIYWQPEPDTLHKTQQLIDALENDITQLLLTLQASEKIQKIDGSE